MASQPDGLSALLKPGHFQQNSATYWALAAATACSTAAGLWWVSRENYYAYVPLRYQYRPGTFTGWIARVLDKHAKRRRRESSPGRRWDKAMGGSCCQVLSSAWRFGGVALD